MFIGLDFETSGTDIDIHAPIQVGIIVPGSPLFVSDIGGWSWADEPWTYDGGGPLADWSEEAAEIHGITKERLLGAPDVGTVDAFAEAYLLDETYDLNPPQRNIVGWNVAAFDLLFLKKWMPWTARLISYRTVDLNAIVFAIVGTDRDGYYEVKNEAKEYAASMIQDAEVYADNRPLWHDAGYDALAAVLSLEYLHDNYIRSHNERTFL